MMSPRASVSVRRMKASRRSRGVWEKENPVGGVGRLFVELEPSPKFEAFLLRTILGESKAAVGTPSTVGAVLLSSFDESCVTGSFPLRLALT